MALTSHRRNVLFFKRRDFRLSQLTYKTRAVIGRIVLARLAQNYMLHEWKGMWFWLKQPLVGEEARCVTSPNNGCEGDYKRASL